MLLCAGLLWACQNSTVDHTAADNNLLKERQSTAPTEGEQKHCFIPTADDQQQDSAYVQLVIRGETVSGTYNHLPYEKDARRGTVLGIIDNDTLDLVWTYKQEGIRDTMRVVFLLKGEKLLRRALAVDSLTGRQFTLDTGDFSEIYEPTDCLK